MDAESQRRVVMEPWCEKCGRPTSNCGDRVQCYGSLNTRPPLWDRCPAMRPEGLEWAVPHVQDQAVYCYEGWFIAPHDKALLDPPAAEALLAWGIVAECERRGVTVSLGDHGFPDRTARFMWGVREAVGGQGEDDLARLAAAAHKYLDAPEASDGT